MISLVFGVVPTYMVSYIQKINISLGLINEGEGITNGLIIEGTNGNLDATLITTTFAIGFVIALVIFLLGPKTKKVGLMDTYTAGEFIHTEELYHYSYRFYAPVVRLYENHPKVTTLYIALVQRVVDLGGFVKYWVFSLMPSRGVLLLTLTLILLLWGETL